MHAQTLEQVNEMSAFSELCFCDLIFHSKFPFEPSHGT